METVASISIKTFRDLIVWQKGHTLVVQIYIATSLFPIEENYALTNQMRRCATSITSNIAEGFSRRGYKEKTQFYSMALGSLTELQNQILIARDIKYINQKVADELEGLSITVHKLLNGLIKATRQKTTHSQPLTPNS
jgi:four helix bundle protein